jgi:metal-sulfur cluster biosynthetic enzyme
MSETAKNKVIWQIESTYPDLVDRLRETLRQVVDPEIGLNIIELALVLDVVVQNNQATVHMILTTPFCPYGPAMLEMTRAKAQEALKIPTIIEMGAEMWDFSYMEEGAGADWGMW